jgi:hypothetical protein
MMPIVRAFLLLLVAIWPATGTAAFQLNDFAYGLRVAAPEKTGLVRLVLPETMYRQLVRADCGDLRVFRADGRAVPHVLRRPDAKDNPGNRLPFFPLYSESNATGGHNVRIRTDASGAVLSLSPPPPEGTDGPAPAYLIDISQQENGIEKLTLTWRRHRPDVLVKVQIEASSDLSQWHPLVDSVTLADIRHGDFRLENRAILLPTRRTDFDYLRLSWLSGGDAITVEQVEGVPTPRNQPPARKWVRAAFRSDLETPGSMQFDSGGVFPVDQIDLELSQGNSLVTGTIKSRASERAVWRIHYQGLFYHLEIKDATLHNDPVMVPETSDRLWMLDIDSRQSGLGSSVPRLMLGGRPHELFFTTEGRGVYIIAYGSRKATPLVPPPELVERVAMFGAQSPLADIGRRIELGGTSRLNVPAAGASGRMMSLSTLLLGCVLLVAFLAWWVVRRILQ